MFYHNTTYFHLISLNNATDGKGLNITWYSYGPPLNQINKLCSLQPFTRVHVDKSIKPDGLSRLF